jgi:hypothetical protein
MFYPFRNYSGLPLLDCSLPTAVSSPEELRDLYHLYHLYHLYRLCPLYRCSSLCIKRGAFRGTPLIDEHGLNMLIPRGVPRGIVNRSNGDALTILSVLVRSEGASVAF